MPARRDRYARTRCRGSATPAFVMNRFVAVQHVGVAVAPARSCAARPSRSPTPTRSARRRRAARPSRAAAGTAPAARPSRRGCSARRPELLRPRGSARRCAQPSRPPRSPDQSRSVARAGAAVLFVERGARRGRLAECSTMSHGNSSAGVDLGRARRHLSRAKSRTSSRSSPLLVGQGTSLHRLRQIRVVSRMQVPKTARRRRTSHPRCTSARARDDAPASRCPRSRLQRSGARRARPRRLGAVPARPQVRTRSTWRSRASRLRWGSGASRCRPPGRGRLTPTDQPLAGARPRLLAERRLGDLGQGEVLLDRLRPSRHEPRSRSKYA